MTPRLHPIYLDRGGTFCDGVTRDPRTGAVRVAKQLSTDRAPLDVIRELLELAPGAPIPPCHVRMGTTLATNALLERRGARTALAITQGFGDLLRIGDQSRPKLFELDIVRPEPLYERVIELHARVAADGARCVSFRADALRRHLERLRAEGIQSLAVALLHSPTAPEDELSVAALAREVGFEWVTLSHEVAHTLGFLARAETCVVDAYLTPVIRAYVSELERALPGSRIELMQSGGDMMEAARFRGRDAVLSGPAGGAVAVADVARRVGAREAIGFDMGGTSTDVCRFAGELERVYEARVAGARLRVPMLDIHTVAAGGGSLCRLQGRRLVVGPESAGARPGPLCYGDPNATELALTDVALFLGRVPDTRFPFPLRRERVARRLMELSDSLGFGQHEQGAARVAEGFLEVAAATMGEAIRKVSVARGHDVRDHALVVFGGAGGQYACRVARTLGVRTLVFHPLAGVLSAYGMGVAETAWHGLRDVAGVPLEEAQLPALQRLADELAEEGRRLLASSDVTEAGFDVEQKVDLRSAGTETSLSVALADAAGMRAAFERAHVAMFGYVRAQPVVCAAVRVRVVLRATSLGPSNDATSVPPVMPDHPTTREAATTSLFLDGAFRDVPLYAREQLPTEVAGPAVITEATATLVIEPGFTVHRRADDILVCTDERDPRAGLAPVQEDTRLDPVRLEIFHHRFMSIAEQMGAVLERTAMSTNIRDRLDFSCAIFDRAGALIANAPHIPVHLGAMSESVLAVCAAHPRMAPGDVFATNDPSGGGSHLPDITVVTPVHLDDTGPAYFVASRGHHADVGGITPGSMPPFSRTLAEEGVVLRALQVVVRGELQEDDLRAALGSGPHPARRPEENLADLGAQIAANQLGERLLRELVAQVGQPVVDAYMAYVQDDAAASVAEAITALPDGEHRFEDALDDGAPICVSARITGSHLALDFTGTGQALDTNLNAPRAVTRAAVMYVLRSLVSREIPLNAGCVRAVTLTIPPGSLLDPPPECAVAGGNVETSQRVVDVLLGALGRAAASQGTMNNLTLGDDHFGYYETIGGGAGASAAHAGASGVHTHMTNSRITDVELLEARYPVRVRRFALRRGSGGAGRHPGGEGLVRELEFLAPLTVSVISERRTRAPFGLAGGQPGGPGANFRNDAALPGKCSVRVASGDVLRIETPGGGGFGPPPMAGKAQP
ncbi:MAG: hydantoinase B/oxoprolinase family protein [Sandaracinaceae bacterium]|nr:hydantoinase B/oxoprolinase family protein [Sandaracinaceae bacterium]